MSIDALQDKIRKRKNALMVDMTLLPSELPVEFQELTPAEGYEKFCREMIVALKGIVPALRFSFSAFALMGDQGLTVLRKILKDAASQGYYVALDAPEMMAPRMAEFAAQTLFSLPCDALIIPVYGGTDMIKPYLTYCAEQKKDVFCVIRTANKSAPELQDLLTGSRLVHLAAADRVSRFSGDYLGKYGYSRLAILAAASSAESLRNLRNKYASAFVLADGLDYPGANMKNAAAAFDKLGRGAVVCAGTSVTCAWKQTEDTDYTQSAAAAAERLNKNLLRYITLM